ncbi:hypothetical protein R1sor_017153 [Riccia sorocarpa]|uniref:Uncharacterized protein n=1 Tax=Riccia sorocarpa TaxID=122646 RepID=A0ABD3IA00_9MARC
MAKNHVAAEDIVSYLNAYLKHMKAIQEKTNPSNKCYESDQAIINYWENIKSLFAAEEGWATNSGLPLQDGFWPRTNHGTGYKRPHDGVQQSAQVDEDLLAREAEEELVELNEIFVGNPSEMERERFVPLVDIEPDASACVHQWKSKSRSEKLKIPESIVRIAREMLDRIAQEET